MARLNYWKQVEAEIVSGSTLHECWSEGDGGGQREKTGTPQLGTGGDRDKTHLLWIGPLKVGSYLRGSPADRR